MIEGDPRIGIRAPGFVRLDFDDGLYLSFSIDLSGCVVVNAGRAAKGGHTFFLGRDATVAAAAVFDAAEAHHTEGDR